MLRSLFKKKSLLILYVKVFELTILLSSAMNMVTKEEWRLEIVLVLRSFFFKDIFLIGFAAVYVF